MSLLKKLNEHNGAVHQKSVQMTEKAVSELPEKESTVKEKLHAYLVEELKKYTQSDETDLAKRIVVLSDKFFESIPERLSFEMKQENINSVLNELTGYGPITPFLNDTDVSEIMVNSYNQIYIERGGKLEKTAARFDDNQHILKVIEKIVSPLGRRIDESVPMVDARLPDGSRINAVISPIALSGPSVTIRKFSKNKLKMDDLIRAGSINVQMSQFLERCIKARLNIVISGGTGSGKSTLLNVLSANIGKDERIITIEDAAELKLGQEHVVSLEARPKNIEGTGEITIRDLVRNALRMRPDRIIVGEVRSGEALDMLQAMNTGHDGSITTGHANSPRDMIARLETMVLMAGIDLPIRAIREQIASAIDLIIHLERMRDGTRKVTHITEVAGMEGDTLLLQDIFLYRHPEADEGIESSSGTFQPTGVYPLCAERFTHYGLSLPFDIWNTEG